jgi:D-3-phosphoglycerate dehydrogenase
MSKYCIVILDDRFGNYREEEKVLEEAGAAVKAYKPVSQTEAFEAVGDADGVLVNLYPIDKRIINRMKKCRIISRYGVGYDNVDVEAATASGIWVANVPNYAFEDVSDHALALLLSCIRKTPYKDSRIRQGGWNLIDQYPCYRIKGKVLGLLGYGAIARALHKKVSGLELSKVITYDPYVKPEDIRENGAVPVDLETLLESSDYISVHAPLSEGTKGIIGKEEIEKMKPTAILINTSRGPLVDEQALCKALQSGRIQGAGLDVFTVEPLPDSSPLKKLDNVILSDHTGYYSEESLVELKTKTALNAASVLQTGKPNYSVNQI